MINVYGLISTSLELTLVAVSCEHSNEHSGSTKEGEFVDQLTDCHIFFFHVVRLSPLGTAATVWPIVPAQDDK
jgi:hypothetical protein